MDSSFYASEPQNLTTGDDVFQQRWLALQNSSQPQELLTPFIDEGSQWAHAHTSVTGYDYFHPLPVTMSYSGQSSNDSMGPFYQQPLVTPALQYGSIPTTDYQHAVYSSAACSSASMTLSMDYSLSPTNYLTTRDIASARPIDKSQGISIAADPSRPLTLTTPSASFTSTSRSSSPSVSSTRSQSLTNISSSSDLSNFGHLDSQTGAWTCAYPQCSSKAMFVRPCDLRKHFNRHRKNFFCRYEGCTQNHDGGFSSKKDRARHESKHNPGVQCEWESCERVFSRVDNMRNHLARIHLKQKRT